MRPPPPRPGTEGGDSPAPPAFGEQLAHGWREIEREVCGDGLVLGALPTGLAPLDAALGGLRPGALYVVAGRPGMGTTAHRAPTRRSKALQLGVTHLPKRAEELRGVGPSERYSSETHAGSSTSDSATP